MRLDVGNGRFVKYTNNRIYSDENYARYLDCKNSEINTTRIWACLIEAY